VNNSVDSRETPAEIAAAVSAPTRGLDDHRERVVGDNPDEGLARKHPKHPGFFCVTVPTKNFAEAYSSKDKGTCIFPATTTRVGSTTGSLSLAGSGVTGTGVTGSGVGTTGSGSGGTGSDAAVGTVSVFGEDVAEGSRLMSPVLGESTFPPVSGERNDPRSPGGAVAVFRARSAATFAFCATCASFRKRSSARTLSTPAFVAAHALISRARLRAKKLRKPACIVTAADSSVRSIPANGLCDSCFLFPVSLRATERIRPLSDGLFPNEVPETDGLLKTLEKRGDGDGDGDGDARAENTDVPRCEATVVTGFSFGAAATDVSLNCRARTCSPYSNARSRDDTDRRCREDESSVSAGRGEGDVSGEAESFEELPFDFVKGDSAVYVVFFGDVVVFVRLFAHTRGFEDETLGEAARAALSAAPLAFVFSSSFGGAEFQGATSGWLSEGLGRSGGTACVFSVFFFKYFSLSFPRAFAGLFSTNGGETVACVVGCVTAKSPLSVSFP